MMRYWLPDRNPEEEETIKTDAKDAFEQALNEELYDEVVGDEMVVGNRHGLELAGFSTRAAALEDEVAS